MDASRNPLNHCRCFAEPVFPAILCEMGRQDGNFSSFNTNIKCHGLNCFTKVISQAMAVLLISSLQHVLPRFSQPVRPHRLRRVPVHRR
ncbi:hypothetical protein C3731_19375 [Brucella oryzae]|uniref:Uncharacterized protein n=1 Tax=Brucella oryzae TaxID=335286 RepID=A0A2S7IVB4_9HYPH|nr:hypothetical protein C3731_19375 [Brucella oryzae]